ncbi:uncharacterized protein LOC133203507 [Saccostrea echinata]|uniref:uncharacterized protein LOC133203507 n=1 Tax=Saccostrea echinata TaxID=191078 RepID=UPI002A7FF0C4|nr:uncharacterized protein LOC133203507 [Saccostrea echinata]
MQVIAECYYASKKVDDGKLESSPLSHSLVVPLSKMKQFVGGLISLIFVSEICCVVWASGCENPLDPKKNDLMGENGKINFENVIYRVNKTIGTNMTEIEKYLTGDDCVNVADCVLEFKVKWNKELGICITSSNERKCIEIKCDCQKTCRLNLCNSDVKLVCTVKAKNNKHRSREDNLTENITEDRNSNDSQQQSSTIRADDISNDRYTTTNPSTIPLEQTGKNRFEDADGFLWFTTGAFVVGVFCGMLLSMAIIFICKKSKNNKVKRMKSEHSVGQDVPLINSDLADSPVYSEITEQKQNDIVQKSQNNDKPQYSSPVYVGEYVEPVNRDRNPTLLQDRKSNFVNSSNVSKQYMPAVISATDQKGDISDPCNHVYNHLQLGIESVDRWQERNENVSLSSETETSINYDERIEKGQDQDSRNTSVQKTDNLNDILDEQQTGSEMGSHSACIPPFLSDVSEEEEIEKKNVNQILSSDQENEYFLLEKIYP